MRGIIYTTEAAAQQAIDQCKTIDQGEISYLGGGNHVELQEPSPYTYFIKHPTKQQWALIADDKVEQLLNKIAIDLPEDWRV